MGIFAVQPINTLISLESIRFVWFLILLLPCGHGCSTLFLCWRNRFWHPCAESCGRLFLVWCCISVLAAIFIWHFRMLLFLHNCHFVSVCSVAFNIRLFRSIRAFSLLKLSILIAIQWNVIEFCIKMSAYSHHIYAQWHFCENMPFQRCFRFLLFAFKTVILF